MSTTNKKVKLDVEGMTCTNCALSINKRLEKVGIKDPQVSFTDGEVMYEEVEGVSKEEVVKNIESLGYHVRKEDAKSSKFAPIEIRFFFAAIFTIPVFLHMFVSHDNILNHPILQIILTTPVYLIGAFYFGKSAWNSLKEGIANMDVLIFIGSTAAFFYSLYGTMAYYGTDVMHDYMFFETAAMIITLVLLGNVLEHRSVKKTGSAIRELVSLQDNTAIKITEQDGEEKLTETDAGELIKGDRVLIKTGDRIPADGIVLSGQASIDESMISGESVPVAKMTDSEVIAGTIVQDGNLRMVVEKSGDETILANIIQLVKEAQGNKPNIQQLADKISAYFVPIVLVIALGTFLVTFLALDKTLETSLMNSIAVLVISCPCAMGLATPTAVVAGIGRAAKGGILIKGGVTLEELSKVKHIVFDKTGTITTGNFKIKEVDLVSGEIDQKQVFEVVLGIENHSSHPIAKSLVNELKEDYQPKNFNDIEEVKGKGMEAKDEAGSTWFLGALTSDEHEFPGVTLKRNDEVVAHIYIEDDIKPGAEALIALLNKRKIETILLSGDKKHNCERVAGKIGIKTIYSEKLPDEKLQIIDELVKKGKTAMVGDGVNDAPALTKADIGISLGNASKAAIQSAQIVLLNDKNLNQLIEALQLGKHTILTIKQNLFWAFFYNVLAIPIAAAGFLSPMIAALAMAFSDVIVVGNSIRLKFKKLN